MKMCPNTWEQLPLHLSLTQVAEVLNISKSQVYILAHQKGFPVIKIGERRLIVPRDALKRWLDNLQEEQGG